MIVSIAATMEKKEEKIKGVLPCLGKRDCLRTIFWNESGWQTCFRRSKRLSALDLWVHLKRHSRIASTSSSRARAIWLWSHSEVLCLEVQEVAQTN